MSFNDIINIVNYQEMNKEVPNFLSSMLNKTRIQSAFKIRLKYYQNNYIYGSKDILMFKIISATLNFEDSNRYDAFHHIKVIKFDALDIKVYS